MRLPALLRLALAAALLLGAARALRAGEPPLFEKRNGAVMVRFAQGTERDAEAAAQGMPGVLAEVSGRLGLPPPAAVEVRVLSAPGFEAMAGPRRGEWAVAMAFSARSLIVVNASRLDLESDLVATLEHETIHLLLGLLEAQTGNRIPLWFHEGLAQLFCGRLFAGTREEFLAAAASRQLLPLAALVDSFPDEGSAVNVAYAQSESFAAFLDRRWPQSPEAVLAAMRRGLPFDAAFREVVGESVPAAEAAWKKDLSSGPPLLLAWLQDNPGLLTWMILGAGGVLLALAWLLVRRRRREAYDRLDGDDSVERGDEDDDGRASVPASRKPLTLDPGPPTHEEEEDEIEDDYEDEDDDDDEDDGWWKGEEEYR
jgi:hypothetical protein